MKTFIMTLLLTITVQAKTIKEGDKEYQCSPVKTCEDQLKSARAEIAKLRKRVKELEAQPAKVITMTEYVEETEVKKHIVSVLAVNDVKKIEASASGNTGKAEVRTGLVPALSYQYQFDMGLTPLLGVSFGKELNPIFGLGYEF
jgi:hypothetical protein